MHGIAQRAARDSRRDRNRRSERLEGDGSRHAQKFQYKVQGGRMKQIKSLTAILVMLTLVLASCGGQTPIVNDATSSTNESAEENTNSELGAEGIIVVPNRIAPTLTIKAIGYQNIDLRVATDLAPFFEITHPTDKKILLNITSDKDGLLYNNVWSTDKLATTLPTLLRTFNTVGTRKITVVASVGSLAAYRNTGTFYLNVINTAPKIVLRYEGNPYQSSDVVHRDYFWMVVQIFDKNEPDYTKLCKNTTLTADGDLIYRTYEASYNNSEKGTCTFKLYFLNIFTYQIRASTHDSEGAEAFDALNVTVQPPRPETQPLITNLKEGGLANLYDTSFQNWLDLTKPAGSNTIRFSTRIFTPTPQPAIMTQNTYTLIVTNPDETETNLLVTQDNGASVRIFSADRWYFQDVESIHAFPKIGNSVPITRDCRLKVKIESFATGLTTTQTMWVGRCTYNTN
jgi:hypothetical protein